MGNISSKQGRRSDWYDKIGKATGEQEGRGGGWWKEGKLGAHCFNLNMCKHREKGGQRFTPRSLAR